METRVALLGIIVENIDKSKDLNNVLHEYNEYIIGRMGIPYSKKGVYVISVAVDAPNAVINALSGKIGKIEGVNVKAVYSKV